MELSELGSSKSAEYTGRGCGGRVGASTPFEFGVRHGSEKHPETHQDELPVCLNNFRRFFLPGWLVPPAVAPLSPAVSVSDTAGAASSLAPVKTMLIRCRIQLTATRQYGLSSKSQGASKFFTTEAGILAWCA